MEKTKVDMTGCPFPKKGDPDRDAKMRAYKAEYHRRKRLTPEGRAELKRDSAAAVARRKSCPELQRKHREKQFRTTHGLTRQEADAMIEKQGGLCAICQKPATGKPPTDRLHVDHCHETGKVREMLCSKCNTALGQFQDDVATLQYAIEYLKKHSNKGTN